MRTPTDVDMPQPQRAMRVALIVPVRNGGEVWRSAAAAVRAQSRQPDRLLVVDSESTDGSDEVARTCGFEVVSIAMRDFDHGGSRQMAAEHCGDCDLLVYLTHDAVLADSEALRRLLRAFDDPQVAVAYGRQLPRREAGPIEAHARLFNYPQQSATRTLGDVAALGMKAAFTSDSYCAYRRPDLMGVGGFPLRTIVSEDMIVAARVLQAGRAIAYVGDSCVVHSHGYTTAQEFRRYFDVGVLHREHAWLLEAFGKPEGEGMRFVRSEVRYLLRHAPWLIPLSGVRTMVKYLGYKTGQHAPWLPQAWLRHFSMQPSYWGARHPAAE